MANDIFVDKTPPGRATMKDVAALAQVSLKTVSRVMNDEGRVNPEMAERVRIAARALRYQVNVGASALRRLDRRSQQIAALLEDLANPFSAAIYRAVEDVAITRGVTVIGGSFSEDAAYEPTLVATMVRHRVDGIIIASASQDHRYLREEQEAGVAMVFVDRPPNGILADCVMSDSRRGAAIAVAHLAASGHRRIAYLGDLETIFTARDRYMGYRDMVAAQRLVDDERYVAHNIRTVEGAYEATRRLLALESPPTAIFAGQNLLTMGALRAIREVGRHHTIALVGFDDFMLADLMEPAVTVVAQNPTVIGREAATLLFRRLDGDVSPYEVIDVPTNLLVRGSGEILAPSH